MRRKNIWKVLKRYFIAEKQELKKFFLASVLVLLLSAVVGYLINPQVDVLNQAIGSIENLANEIKDDSFISVAMLIFFNNLRSAALTVVLGVFVVVPYLTNLSNGLLIGIVVRTKTIETGNKLLALQLIPHGILEIPAICLATALGVRLGVGMFSSRDKLELFKKTGLTFLVVVVMLFFAALIESAFF